MPQDLRTKGSRGERGTALAELTIVVPIMLVLLLVVFDFGRGFMEYVSVSNGARDGARVAAQYDMDCNDAGDRDAIKDIALAAADPLAHAVPSPKITVTPGADGLCSVTIEHQYQLIIPLIDEAFTLPIVGTIGPLWDGRMTETMVSA